MYGKYKYNSRFDLPNVVQDHDFYNEFTAVFQQLLMEYRNRKSTYSDLIEYGSITEDYREELKQSLLEVETYYGALAYFVGLSNGCMEITEPSQERPDMEVVFDMLEKEKNQLEYNKYFDVDVSTVDRVMDRMKKLIEKKGIDIFPDEVTEYVNEYSVKNVEDHIVIPKIFENL